MIICIYLRDIYIYVILHILYVEDIKELTDRQVTDLNITGELSNFPFSHAGNHFLPHRELELLPQYELHRFTVTSHCPGVIQHGAITKACAVMKRHLSREKYK